MTTQEAFTPTVEGESGDVIATGLFLLQRLTDHEVRMESDADAREWFGHVTPAIARFRAALNALREHGKEMG
jgi:hypothetical protein